MSSEAMGMKFGASGYNDNWESINRNTSDTNYS